MILNKLKLLYCCLDRFLLPAYMQVLAVTDSRLRLTMRLSASSGVI